MMLNKISKLLENVHLISYISQADFKTNFQTLIPYILKTNKKISGKVFKELIYFINLIS